MLALTAAFATAAPKQNAVQEWILQKSLVLADDEYRAMNRAFSAMFVATGAGKRLQRHLVGVRQVCGQNHEYSRVRVKRNLWPWVREIVCEQLGRCGPQKESEKSSDAHLKLREKSWRCEEEEEL